MRPRRRDFARALLRSFSIQGSWNHRTMTGPGMAFALSPLLARIHADDPGALHAALERHAGAFNAHPYLAPVAIGSLARLEYEQEETDTLLRFRAALRAPLGALGDETMWAGWRPFLRLGRGHRLLPRGRSGGGRGHVPRGVQPGARGRAVVGTAVRLEDGPGSRGGTGARPLPQDREVPHPRQSGAHRRARRPPHRTRPGGRAHALDRGSSGRGGVEWLCYPSTHLGCGAGEPARRPCGVASVRVRMGKAAPGEVRPGPDRSLDRSDRFL